MAGDPARLSSWKSPFRIDRNLPDIGVLRLIGEGDGASGRGASRMAARPMRDAARRRLRDVGRGDGNFPEVGGVAGDGWIKDAADAVIDPVKGGR